MVVEVEGVVEEEAVGEEVDEVEVSVAGVLLEVAGVHLEVVVAVALEAEEGFRVPKHVMPSTVLLPFLGFLLSSFWSNV